MRRITDYYSVEVDLATHDDLQLGLTATETVWVAISPQSVHCETDAILLACQFAHSLNRHNGMPTAARLLNWPEPRARRSPVQQARYKIKRALRRVWRVLRRG